MGSGAEQEAREVRTDGQAGGGAIWVDAARVDVDLVLLGQLLARPHPAALLGDLEDFQTHGGQRKRPQTARGEDLLPTLEMSITSWIASFWPRCLSIALST